MLRSLLLHLIAVVLIVQAVSWFRERSLLPADTQAPMFYHRTLEHGWLSRDDLLGKPTVLYFFAPWCSICKYSMPNLEAMQRDGWNIVAVALSYQDPAEVEDFVADLHLSMPVVLGNDHLLQDYQIRGFPTYYVLDAQGRVQRKSLGWSSRVGLELRVR
ncbi:TlpA disulfide reductase family protein [Alkalimonas amylolytica]|uniref:Thiol-disulfide isomerase or thioredoxin n=1 Tax=Alkalimonas amylolytica TaxID=152573 RepID=A0A1H3ZAK3_ALKAM|nr:TlpA disulfide reductase family protein [Alkalimonas amylolytica]SEA20655.1 Thiol-disulfide isomerase or thioredoxin [Alkalimonas amylolytica]